MASYSAIITTQNVRQDNMLSSFLSNFNAANPANVHSSIEAAMVFMVEGNIKDWIRQSRDGAAAKVAVAWASAGQSLQQNVWSALGLGSALPL